MAQETKTLRDYTHMETIIQKTMKTHCIVGQNSLVVYCKTCLDYSQICYPQDNFFDQTRGPKVG